MGQNADDFLEQVIDQENLRSDFHNMTPLEKFEAGLVNELGEFPQDRNKVRTNKFLAGFKAFYIKHGYLSKKQRIIIDKNVSGGVDAFIKNTKGE